MSSPEYQPGLHALLTLHVTRTEFLMNAALFVQFTDLMLAQFELEKVGFSQHVFENASYTIAYCLKESHICIHTWPEHQQLTLDIYLCNYQQDNSEKVRALAQAYIDFFEATILKQFEIQR
ncbi:S-adenosylmethionine decarboxylase [Flavobacterium fontis]|jgi:S-adenosylmethionine decarboxylase|uniref:S-adenosylmethionine decarboxylase n=2 Tax=Flavobacterium TaxID=237 RepID=A0A1M4WTM2_9FLAO|nr:MULTISPECIES: S-adenosylmethionine decarboxylase [Flavobacterium]MCZ8168600.1 S-adenosylmethionine decarboxylase [Flavobacterium sp.]MCZ8297284.1 S-adenosylmethionine decarboxylase [Flavobacterium sp.]SHE84579.1 S-adenosylmethionine decarboxylase [Flavobacterium fontis]